MSTQSMTITTKLSSTRDEIPRVEEFVEELTQIADIGEDNYNRILLGLSEAVTNAIVHGNKLDPSKEVEIKAWIDGPYVKVRIRDQGEGFDPDSLPDPRKEDHLLKEGGRGVFLMHQYADDVTYTDGGSTVSLAFKLQGEQE